MQKVVITGHDLTLDPILAVCREGAEVVLSDESREKILASRQVVHGQVMACDYNFLHMLPLLM